METLKIMLNISKEKIVFIPLLFVFVMIAIFYGYCYVAEHTILSVEQNSVIKRDRFTNKFTITAKCKAVSAFTFAPYVSVRINGFEALTIAVNPGYDLLGDCMRSSVERVELSEIENKVRIYMKSGQIKEANIIYDSK